MQTQIPSKCINCGGQLSAPPPGENSIVCPYCGAKNMVNSNFSANQAPFGQSMQPNMAQFRIGDRIMGNWKSGGTFYPGVIDQIQGNSYHIRYDDGDQEWTTADKLQSPNMQTGTNFRIGDRIMGNWKSGGTFYPGVIDQIQGNSYHIRYDDGDQEWTTADKLQSQNMQTGANPYNQPSQFGGNFGTNFRIGDRIMGNWKSGGTFYPGVIDQIQGNSYHIRYDDGDQEWTTADKLQSPNMQTGANPYNQPSQFGGNFGTNFRIGDRIMGNWKGGGTFYPGTIDQIQGNSYHIRYDDGDQEWTTADKIQSH